MVRPHLSFEHLFLIVDSSNIIMHLPSLVRSLFILVLVETTPTGSALGPRLSTGGGAYSGAGEEPSAAQRKGGIRGSDQGMAASSFSSRSLLLGGSGASSNRGLVMMSMMKKSGCKSVKGKGGKGGKGGKARMMSPKMNCTNVPTPRPSTKKPTGRSGIPAPSSFPSIEPSDRPSLKPSVAPSRIPTVVPSSYPSREPSFHPSLDPSDRPSGKPSTAPSQKPVDQFCLSTALLPSNGHRYHVEKGNVNIDEAFAVPMFVPHCCGQKAHLATLNDEAEDILFNNLTLQADVHTAAFGLLGGGNWYWLNNENLSEYAKKKAESIPGNPPAQYATYLGRQNGGVGPGVWNSFPGFIFQKLPGVLLEYDCSA